MAPAAASVSREREESTQMGTALYRVRVSGKGGGVIQIEGHFLP